MDFLAQRSGGKVFYVPKVCVHGIYTQYIHATIVARDALGVVTEFSFIEYLTFFVSSMLHGEYPFFLVLHVC